MFQNLINLSEKAFEGRQFNVSYHILSAALHYAVDEKSQEHLSLVEQMAAEQLAYIDTNYPNYEHSSHSAKEKGHESIFHLLARQANAKVLLLNRQHL